MVSLSMSEDLGKTPGNYAYLWETEIKMYGSLMPVSGSHRWGICSFCQWWHDRSISEITEPYADIPSFKGRLTVVYDPSLMKSLISDRTHSNLMAMFSEKEQKETDFLVIDGNRGNEVSLNAI